MIKMPKILTDTKTETKILKDGTKTEHTEKHDVEITSGEPAYIKLYMDNWMMKDSDTYGGSNGIPQRYRLLFLELAMHMSPCDYTDLEQSQIVNVYGKHKKIYMDAMGWKNDSSLKQGLKALCNCEAIRRVDRGIYQINPSYAAKGKWLNARADKNPVFSGLKKLAESYNRHLNQSRKEKKEEENIPPYNDPDHDNINPFNQSKTGNSGNSNPFAVPPQQT